MDNAITLLAREPEEEETRQSLAIANLKEKIEESETWETSKWKLAGNPFHGGSHRSNTHSRSSDWDILVPVASKEEVYAIEKVGESETFKVKSQKGKQLSGRTLMEELAVALAKVNDTTMQPDAPSISFQYDGSNVDLVPVLPYENGFLLPCGRKSKWRFFDHSRKDNEEKRLAETTNGDWNTVTRALKVIKKRRSWNISSYALQAICFNVYKKLPQGVSKETALLHCLTWLANADAAEAGLMHPFDSSQKNMLCCLPRTVKKSASLIALSLARVDLNGFEKATSILVKT